MDPLHRVAEFPPAKKAYSLFEEFKNFAFKGSVSAILFQLVGGVRASMGYCGCRTIAEMHDKAGFVEITSAGIRESHVHDVQITKEAPNYHVE